MITINLLPTQRKRITAPAPNQAMIMIFALFLAAGALATAYYFRVQLAERRELKEQLVADQAAYVEDVKIAHQLQAQLDALQQRKKLIEELLYSGPEIARKLNQISDLIPAKIWLEQIKMETTEKQEQRVVTTGQTRTSRTVRVETTMLTLTGVTEDLTNGPSLVAEFISRLHNSPFMEDFVGEIRPQYQAQEAWLSTGGPGGARPVWRFTLSMQMDKEARRARGREKEEPARSASGGTVAKRAG